jgi:hypothetical protein
LNVNNPLLGQKNDYSSGFLSITKIFGEINHIF